MLIARFGFLRLFVSLAFLGGLGSLSHAAGWFDNFNDMNNTTPVAWTNDIFGLFPGNYDVSSGDFEMSNPGTTDEDIMVSYVGGVTLADSYIRTQGVVLPDPLDPVNHTGGNLIPIGRLDPNTLSLYTMYFDVDDGDDVGGGLVLQVVLGGGITSLAGVELIDFDASQETVMELDIIGDTLNGYVWQTGPRPANPQVTTTVSGGNLLASGNSGLIFKEDEEGTKGVFRYAMAQDTPIVETFGAGDFNADGKVDAADYVTWRNGYVPFDPMQPNLRSIYTLADYDIWKAKFGTGAGVGSAIGAIPEPSSLVLVLAAISASVLSIGRRRPNAG